jgi:hypothetical protein
VSEQQSLRPAGHAFGCICPACKAWEDRRPTVDLDIRRLETAGWLCALTALFIPIVGLAGLIIGAILAGKPGKASRGASVIILSIVLAAASSVFWYEHFLTQTASQSSRSGAREENGHLVTEVTPEQQEAARRSVEEKHTECAPYCVGENEPAG